MRLLLAAAATLFATSSFAGDNLQPYGYTINAVLGRVVGYAVASNSCKANEDRSFAYKELNNIASADPNTLAIPDEFKRSLVKLGVWYRYAGAMQALIALGYDATNDAKVFMVSANRAFATVECSKVNTYLEATIKQINPILLGKGFTTDLINATFAYELKPLKADVTLITPEKRKTAANVLAHVVEIGGFEVGQVHQKQKCELGVSNKDDRAYALMLIGDVNSEYKWTMVYMSGMLELFGVPTKRAMGAATMGFDEGLHVPCMNSGTGTLLSVLGQIEPTTNMDDYYQRFTNLTAELTEIEE